MNHISHISQEPLNPLGDRIPNEAVRRSKECRIKIESDADVVLARRTGRSLATSFGFASNEVALITTIISALAQNVLAFAKRGEIHLCTLHLQKRRAGFEAGARAGG